MSATTTADAPFNVADLIAVPASGRMTHCDYLISDLQKIKFTFERGLPINPINLSAACFFNLHPA